MVGNLIQQQYFGADNWPFGSALTIVLMGFLAIFMVFYLRGSRSSERREALRMSVAAERPAEVAGRPPRAAARRAASTARAGCGS